MTAPVTRFADSYIGPARTRVLLEVIRQPHPTVRSVAAGVGITPRTVQQHLASLRSDGLVDWVDGSQGTLHATMRPVRFGPAITIYAEGRPPVTGRPYPPSPVTW